MSLKVVAVAPLSVETSVFGEGSTGETCHAAPTPKMKG
jgi:hypothetical protein